MKTERRNGMIDIAAKLDRILDVVAELQQNIAVSQFDRTSLHDDIIEVKNGVDKINGNVRKHAEDIAVFKQACVTYDKNISWLWKVISSVAFLMIGSIITAIIQHLTK